MSEGSDGLAGSFEALGEVTEELEENVEALRETSKRIGWFRLEYAILTGLVLLLSGYLVAYLVFDVDLDKLKDWGYLGIFFIAMAGSATIVLPTPSTVAIFGGAVVLNPVLGIPAPICVGLVAGLGDAIGEFSGYGLGYAGTDLLRQRRVYLTFERWMRTNGVLTIFLLSTFPNPLFDLVGAAAGGARMPAARFFFSTLAGKIVKDTFLAYGGTFSAGVLTDLL
ncbi:MAG TPA: VTT domain-containing protein [Dehalococcoidia bacterium]|jgi:membrane protein YqaA with SNARE-associated domain